MLMAGSV